MSTRAGRRSRTSAKIEILLGHCGRAEDEERSRHERGRQFRDAASQNDRHLKNEGPIRMRRLPRRFLQG